MMTNIILTSIHGDSITKMVHTSINTENNVGGADTSSGGANTWSGDHHSHRNTVSTSPSTTAPTWTPPKPSLTSHRGQGHVDITPVTASLPVDEQQKQQAEEALEEKDPLATNEKINKPEEALVGGFKVSKDSDSDMADPMAALTGIGG